MIYHIVKLNIFGVLVIGQIFELRKTFDVKHMFFIKLLKTNKSHHINHWDKQFLHVAVFKASSGSLLMKCKFPTA